MALKSNKFLNKNWTNFSHNLKKFSLVSDTLAIMLQDWGYMMLKRKKLKNWVLLGVKIRHCQKFMSIKIPMVHSLAGQNSLMGNLFLLIKFTLLWVTGQDISSKTLVKEQLRTLTFQLLEFQQTYSLKRHQILKRSSMKKDLYNQKSPATTGPLPDMMKIMFC